MVSLTVTKEVEMVDELQNNCDPHTKKAVTDTWLKGSYSLDNTENVNRLAEQMEKARKK